VIVPAISFVASANCVAYTGAQPVFADVDPDSGLVVVDDIARRITRRTRAVIPVHLNGQPADLRPLRGLGLPVLADAAHALGATYQGLPIGDPALADLAILSFHPVKHITTGEGGAIVTSDERLYRRLRVFRDHGIVRDSGSFEQAAPGPWYYEQQQLGHNLRLCDLQCALGTSQLTKLDRFVARRREIAARYTQRLQALPHVTPVAQGTESAFHLFPVLIDFAALGRSRAQVMAELRARQIGSQVHYIPIPAQPYYAHLGYTLLGLEGAQRYYDRVLSLPMYPALSDADVDYVVESLAAIVRT
jgi:dTDP-4-amino-4,6-dideoxygalactose transaminase